MRAVMDAASPHSVATGSHELKLLPAYTGVTSLHDALQDPRSVRLLWLEILVNDRLDLSRWLGHPTVREAYSKACRWHTHYRGLIQSLVPRAALPLDSGPIDLRESRTLFEALRFVSAHH